MRKFAVLLICLLCSNLVFANAIPEAIVLEDVSPKQFVKRVSVLKKFAPRVKSDLRADYLADATSLSRRLSDISEFSELEASDQAKLLTDYESLRTRAADIDVKVCERVSRVGSNMMKTICITQKLK